MDKKIFIKIEPDKIPTMNIHSDGKPFFGLLAIKLMALRPDAYFKIAKGRKEKCIFLFPVNKAPDALKISKVGNYFCFTKIALFRKLGFVRGDKYPISTVKYKDETIFKISL